MSNAKMAEAYPLQWPAGWKRTPSWNRGKPRFKGTFGQVRDGLLKEIQRFGGTLIVLSTNVPLRNDGLPYSGARAPEDPGVAVYFQRKGKPVSFACDKWETVADNIRALELTLDAMRGIERWGSSEMMERSFSGFTALPPPPAENVNRTWRAILGFPVLTVPTMAMVKNKRNELLRKFHPDIGEQPDHSACQDVNRAFEEAEKELA